MFCWTQSANTEKTQVLSLLLVSLQETLGISEEEAAQLQFENEGGEKINNDDASLTDIGLDSALKDTQKQLGDTKAKVDAENAPTRIILHVRISSLYWSQLQNETQILDAQLEALERKKVEEEEQNAAAIKIQSQFRGDQARKSFTEMKQTREAERLKILADKKKLEDEQAKIAAKEADLAKIAVS